jgi:glycosyltransferase involved in cell wall biosynthesis
MFPMKVLVFAHTPPPFHGQSFMVAQLLKHVGQPDADGRRDITFYHVNAQLSRGIEDIGSWRIWKLLLLVRYVLQAWLVFLRHRPEVFYYVPAPAKASALCRDWLVLTMVAPLFKFRVYHWHGAGLGQWIAARLKSREMFLRAWLTQRLFHGHELSIVMNEYCRREVEVFSPRRVEIVANGISDPCPDFAASVLPDRIRRWKERVAGNGTAQAPFELLFLGQATASKGLFNAVEAVARANAQLEKAGSAERLRLTVAGAFVDAQEEELFRQRIEQKDLRLIHGENSEPAVIYAGFVGKEAKERLLRGCDALCFASYFPNEVQPVSVVEALAFGMPVLLSRWHDLPAMIPDGLSHLTEPDDPAALAEALPLLFKESRFDDYRQCYLDRYTLALHCQRMKEVLLSLGKTERERLGADMARSDPPGVDRWQAKHAKLTERIHGNSFYQPSEPATGFGQTIGVPLLMGIGLLLADIYLIPGIFALPLLLMMTLMFLAFRLPAWIVAVWALIYACVILTITVVSIEETTTNPVFRPFIRTSVFLTVGSAAVLLAAYRQRLEVGHESLSRIISSLPLAVIVSDIAGNILLLNDQAQQLLKNHINELAGLSYFSIFTSPSDHGNTIAKYIGYFDPSKVGTISTLLRTRGEPVLSLHAALTVVTINKHRYAITVVERVEQGPAEE